MKNVHTRLNEQELMNRINNNFSEVVPTGVATVLVNDSETQVRELIEQLPTPDQANLPAGAGRVIKIPAGKIEMPVTNLSSMDAINGMLKGVSTIWMGVQSALTAGEYGHLTVLNNGLQNQGLKAQGHIRDVTFFGDSANTPANVVMNGYYYPGVGDPDGHTIMDAEFANYSGTGYKIVGSKQGCMIRPKSTNNKIGGFEVIGGGDMKWWAPGGGGNGKFALRLDKAATPYIFAFDFWNPNAGYEGEYTVILNDQARAVLHTGVIAGRTLVEGRNDQGLTARYDHACNTFDTVCFKVDEKLPAMYTVANAKNGTTYSYYSQVTCKDTDGTIFRNCMFIMNDVVPTTEMLNARPDYFLSIQQTGGTARRAGHVKFEQMSGLVHRRGRTDDAGYEPILAFKKGICDRMDLIEWGGFIPGEIKCVPTARLADNREYLASGTYTKAMYPIGYLFFTPGGTLDDLNATFTIPAGPVAAPAGMSWAGKVWP
jgi:hypothetical protein